MTPALTRPTKHSGIEWIGKIPSHWSVLPFYSFADEVVHKNTGLKERNLLSLSYGRLVRKDMDRLAGLTPASFEGYNVVEQDDIVFRLTDLQNDQTSLRSARSPERGIITAAYVSVRPRSSPQFFGYLMRSYDTAKVFYGIGGGIRQSMKFADLKRLSVVVPPAHEMDEIVSYLDRATSRIDDLVAKKTRFIELIREKRQALITHVVTKGLDASVPMQASGIEWLGEVPAHWSVMALRRVCSRLEQGWSPDCGSQKAEEGEWGVLKSGCVNGGVFNPAEHKALPKSAVPRPGLEVRDGDVLMSRASGSKALIGSVAFVTDPPPKLMLSDKIFRLALSRQIDGGFLALMMGCSTLRTQIEQAIGGAEGLANNLSQESIKCLSIVVPPRGEQQAIVDSIKARAQKLDTLIAKTERSIELLREHRTALIAAAVTGKIDMREAA